MKHLNNEVIKVGYTARFDKREVQNEGMGILSDFTQSYSCRNKEEALRLEDALISIYKPKHNMTDDCLIEDAVYIVRKKLPEKESRFILDNYANLKQKDFYTSHVVQTVPVNGRNIYYKKEVKLYDAIHRKSMSLTVSKKIAYSETNNFYAAIIDLNSNRIKVRLFCTMDIIKRCRIIVHKKESKFTVPLSKWTPVLGNGRWLDYLDMVVR